MRPFLALISIVVFFNCKNDTISGVDYSKLESIPTKEQVGQLVLPDTIAPVSAPFEMPAFEKPTFPDRSINILDRDADTSKLVTTHIQNSIDELSALGGGTVVIPQSTIGKQGVLL
ncbi:hypothetical protein [Thalassobellus suaedae]|uniref:Uncharacterized protein n=1 Tax=Thalassobellus suaedae TaxID=3074124 RepID=A0ABY9XSS0_9FLAO|nr:hypothetical protein RHP51_18470 [Flavobacteriaceae bacterium HL-DH14]